MSNRHVHCNNAWAALIGRLWNVLITNPSVQCWLNLLHGGCQLADSWRGDGRGRNSSFGREIIDEVCFLELSAEVLKEIRQRAILRNLGTDYDAC